MKYLKLILFIMMLGVIQSNIYSQTEKSNINFFLECDDCDFTFVRQELEFISFVRDPQLADVHILVTDSHTGGGGSKYFMNFIGLKDFKDINYEYITTTQQSDTDDDVRKALLKTLKVGILPYYSKKDMLGNLNIDLEESENRKADDMVIDPWNKWIFRIGSGGSFQKEASQSEYSIDLNTSARKVTEEWKTSFAAYYGINRETYFDEGEEIPNKQDNKEVEADFVKSLTGKWSAGLFGNYRSNTFLNLKHRLGASAGVEYNFFPWEECDRRILAIRYTAGVNGYAYFEETIYDKLKETLYSQALEINLELIQPWGEIQVGLEGSHYFHDFSKNRLTFESDFSIRVTRNLSVYCELVAEAVHNQLYLPKGDASLEDILLKRRKLATTYEMGGRLGFRFTFGSIYNNVVNQRF